VNRLVLIVLLTILMGGCAHNDKMNRSVYNMLHDQQCVKETGNPHCDHDRKTYDEYKEEREKLKND
jgi:hypothetical protein